MTKRPNKSIPLSVREEETLTRLAAEHGSYSRTGPTAGMPSWRRLVADLARGEFVIRRRRGPAEQVPVPAAVPVAVPVAVVPDPVVESASVDASPLWWPRDEDGSLMVFAKVKGERATQCESMGLELADLGFVAKDEWLVPTGNSRPPDAIVVGCVESSLEVL